MRGLLGSLFNLRGSEGFAGLRRFFFPLFLSIALLPGCDFRRPPPEEKNGRAGSTSDPSEEIAAMLHASTSAWNAGELDGYLDDYWASEDLTFSGADGVTRGWEDLRTRYLSSYWAPESPRDSLRFEELEISPLGEDHALALGRYILYQPEDSDVMKAMGFFSLVLGKVDGEWRILHDHTSTAPDREEPGGAESDLTGVG